MGNIKPFTPWKLVIGILFAGTGEPASLNRRLESEFGAIDYTSPILPFTYTDYYTREMGSPLGRRFFGFRDLVEPGRLAGIKIATNKIEEEYPREKNSGPGRQVNLDPGILNLSRFILATTKDNSHRIPLGEGIYAELTLRYTHKDFESLPWTYPDYATQEYRGILRQIREIFHQTLKHDEVFRCNK